MGIINITPVKSGQSKVLIGIAGVSGSGKTYTALQIARGMVKKPSEIGFLDTENKRGSLYADILDGPFMIGDLYPPFSPSRYIQAIKEFQDHGVKVLVIDSVSHEFEGTGGCDDIANAPKADGTERKDEATPPGQRACKVFTEPHRAHDELLLLLLFRFSAHSVLPMHALLNPYKLLRQGCGYLLRI